MQGLQAQSCRHAGNAPTCCGSCSSGVAAAQKPQAEAVHQWHGSVLRRHHAHCPCHRGLSLSCQLNSHIGKE